MRKLALVVLLVLLLVPAAAPAATTSTVVVEEVFAGGGNTGAPYANDYVVLFNRGSTAVDISSWTLQYASAASSAWSVTALTGSIAAGRHYLVQLASGGTAGAALPTADSTGTLSLAASGGKIALVKQTAALTCTSSCSAVTAVADLVGWGTATDYEGSAAAPALTNTTAAIRDGGGCVDTDDNAADFSTGAPAPRNASTAVATCSGGTTSSGLTGSVNVTLDLQPVLSLSLNRSSVAFGAVLAGSTPPAVSVAATVVSNSASGYSLTAHRTAFAPADLPLAIAARATDPLVLLPIAPAADLQLAQTSAPSLAAGDTWTTTLGFVGPLSALTPARYTATVTYTVLAR